MVTRESDTAGLKLSLDASSLQGKYASIDNNLWMLYPIDI